MTTAIARKAQVIGLETLNVGGMLKNHRLARSIADASFAEIARQLEYKAVLVVRVDRFFPSSKTCNSCGAVNHKLTLK